MMKDIPPGCGIKPFSTMRTASRAEPDVPERPEGSVAPAGVVNTVSFTKPITADDLPCNVMAIGNACLEEWTRQGLTIDQQDARLLDIDQRQREGTARQVNMALQIADQWYAPPAAPPAPVSVKDLNDAVRAAVSAGVNDVIKSTEATAVALANDVEQQQAAKLRNLEEKLQVLTEALTDMNRPKSRRVERDDRGQIVRIVEEPAP